MLVRTFKRLLAFLCSLLLVAYLVSAFRDVQNDPKARHTLSRRREVNRRIAVETTSSDHQSPLALLADSLDTDDDEDNYAGEEDTRIKDTADDTDDGDEDSNDLSAIFGIDDIEYVEGFNTDRLQAHANDNEDDTDGDYAPLPESTDYREIFSLTTRDRKFFPLYLGGVNAYNPNIIPHPTQHDLWIVIAQHEQSGQQITASEELYCDAGFLNGVLVCTAQPTVLPVTPSISGNCPGDLAYYNFRRGPRDARVFYGPDAPYIVYGSQSRYTCLGIWLHDVRMLLQVFRLEQFALTKLFRRATELQRPPPHHGVEKNFFIFWDSAGKAYVHHDIYPARVFAELSYDGSVGPNIAPRASNNDNVCMAKYMPTVGPELESIHQATNSLSITLCRRKDPFCVPSDTNTFIMTIFQHKSYHDWHGVYEPYVMLFQRTAPFNIHAISQRPLWIHGRGPLTRDTHSLLYDNDPGKEIPSGHSEMFYITSMSWKTHGQRYHGYMDDPLFLAFGIEDTRPAAIDVLAGDLLQDLAYCTHQNGPY